MARVKRGVTSHAKHKKVLKAAKGYRGRRKNTIRIAKQAVEKAGQYAFRDRKRKKRTFRALWIQRLNAAVRPFGLKPLIKRLDAICATREWIETAGYCGPNRRRFNSAAHAATTRRRQDEGA